MLLRSAHHHPRGDPRVRSCWARREGPLAVEAFLLAHGYRVRNVPGAHLAVVEVVDRWLRASDEPGPRIARSFAFARKARNEDEYPSPRQAERTPRELRALALDNARLINVVRDALGLPEEPTIVPTPQNLRGRG